MSLIAPHVYLSSIVYAKDKFFMGKENIKYCLVVGTELT